MKWIGVDTGAHTGLAVWDGRQFVAVETMPIHKALLRVKEMYDNRGSEAVAVVFEDARQRKWFPKVTAAKDRARLQGAGSVKRDATIWETALRDWGIPFVMKAPKDNITKMNPDYFAKLTGWTGRTSEHSRDAAMLVFGRTAKTIFDL